MADDKKVTVVATTGTATGGDPSGYDANGIQAAMDQAAQALFSKGIHDPDQIRDAKLAAREKFKSASRPPKRKRR